MVESSLVSLLKKFDKQKLKDFSNFVKSPFFNTNKAVIKLYEYIRKQHPEFKTDKLEKKFVYKKIFGNAEYNDGFMRVLMSNLQALALQYITYKGMTREEELIKTKYLLDELNELGERKLAVKILNNNLKSVEKITPKDPDEYLGLYYMAFYRKYFYSTQFEVNKKNLPDEKLLNEQVFFTYHFLLRTLANHFYHLNQKHVINYEPSLIFLDEIMTFLEKNPEYLKSPVLNITYLRVILLKNNDIADYYKLKNAFHSSFSKIQKKDAFNTVSVIINYCQKNYSLTEDDLYLREKFEILKFAVDNNLNTFDESEGFDANRFTTIVNAAMDLNQVTWAENFLKEYSEELLPSLREQILIFGYSLLYFHKKMYSEALSTLAKFIPSAATDKFKLKVLQLKIYYEMGYIEQAEAAADSFRHLIQNDKLLPEFINLSFKNFYLLYIKLLSLKLKGEVHAADMLEEQINNTRPVMEKIWLIKQCNELIK